MNGLADVAHMLVRTPYLSVALAFTLVVLALDAWTCAREPHADADNEAAHDEHARR